MVYWAVTRLFGTGKLHCSRSYQARRELLLLLGYTTHTQTSGFIQYTFEDTSGLDGIKAMAHDTYTLRALGDSRTSAPPSARSDIAGVGARNATFRSDATYDLDVQCSRKSMPDCRGIGKILRDPPPNEVPP